MQNYNPSRPNPEDSPLLVTFFDKPIHNDFKSKKEGKAIWEDQEYIQIVVPFKPDGEVERKVTSKDIGRFPSEYEAFKKKEKVKVNGTLIANWNFPNKGQVQMLTSQKVITVEQLAGFHDAQIARMGFGARELRNAAIDFVAQTPNREVKELREQLAEQADQIAQLLENKDVNTNGGAKRSTGNRASKQPSNSS